MAAAMKDNPSREGIHEALNREDFEVRDTADAQPLKFKDGERIASAQIVEVQVKSGSDPKAPQCEFVPVE
jgi:hypothetical protein